MDSEIVFVAPETGFEHVFVENTSQEGSFFPKFVTDVTFSEKLENFWA